ncbi:RNA polymerase sigma factor [Corallococcus sicarius]|uniref:Sigma-70 family RNA polymerase sigma factor n=1 Tax=Corallococcus sicarius TaxID=2316726 RepID=A0A3A8N934_9BACT|nr:sigma-70 family RNA polymerase sigma factor [Corallococcus sicarius]RKH37645.1 sigma-70 family RNA polymerase sigma factor [Corallococcus sicarius]
MSFPSREEERRLHERILERDPVAPADVFRLLIPYVMKTVRMEMHCSQEDARDSAIDAILIYLNEPERYDRQKKTLLRSFLTHIAKMRSVDRYRSWERRVLREQKYAEEFELGGRSPKEVMEETVEARRAIEKFEQMNLDDRDQELLHHVLLGEGSTEKLAQVLGHESLPKDERQQMVKRDRDRVLKSLRRFGREDSHDES